MTVFIFLAKGVVLLTGIVILLAVWILIFNNWSIRQEKTAKNNRSTLRQTLMSYLKEEIDIITARRRVAGKENLLVGLVSQISEELGEPSRLKLIDLFDVSGRNSIVQTELHQLLHATNWRKRQRAATYLPYIAKNTVIIGPLRHALEDRVFMVRFSAAHSLAKIKATESIIPILEHLSLPSEWPIERTIEIIYEMGKDTITPLLHYLFLPTAKNECKVFAISALGLQHVSEAIPVILTHLTNPDKELRIQSAKALGNIGATEATFALCNAMKDSDWEVRAASANALGSLKNNSSIPVLLRSLEDAVWWVRYNSANALAESGSDGITALKEVNLHDDRFAREVSRLVLQERSLIRIDQKQSVP